MAVEVKKKVGESKTKEVQKRLGVEDRVITIKEVFKPNEKLSTVMELSMNSSKEEVVGVLNTLKKKSFLELKVRNKDLFRSLASWSKIDDKQVSETFSTDVVREEFGEIKDVKDMLRVYSEILGDKRFESLFLAMKNSSYKELAAFLEDLDLISAYVFLKKIFPRLLASGVSPGKIEKLFSLISLKIDSSYRNARVAKALRIFNAMRKFLRVHAMPSLLSLFDFLKAL